MHRCVSKAVSCLSLGLHSHAIARARTAWSPATPLRLTAGNKLPICSIHGLRDLHATATLGMTSSTETLSGTGGQMLIGKADAYEGFIVSPQDLPSSSADFDSQLQNSLQVRMPQACTSLCTAYDSHISSCICRTGNAVAPKVSGSTYQQRSLS